MSRYGLLLYMEWQHLYQRPAARILGGASSDLALQWSLDRIYLTVVDKAAGGEYKDAQRAELHTVMHIVIANIAAVAAPIDIIAPSWLATITVVATHRSLHHLHSLHDVADKINYHTRPHHAFSATSSLIFAGSMICASL